MSVPDCYFVFLGLHLPKAAMMRSEFFQPSIQAEIVSSAARRPINRSCK